MKLIAASTRAAAASGSALAETDSPADDIAPKKIRAKVCSHVLVELPVAGAQHRADDVEDVGEGRALLLLAEPRVAEHRRPSRITILRYAGSWTTARNARSPAMAFSHGSRSPLRDPWIAFEALASTRSKTASNSACLPLKWW